MKREPSKLFVNIIFFTLFFCFFNVNASNAILTLKCDNSALVVLNSITCDVFVETDASINNISFLTEGNGLNLTFKEESGFTNNGTSSNGISLHKDDNINNGKVGTLTIEAPGTISEGAKTIALKNIVITNSNDDTIVFNNDDIIQDINVLSNKSNNNKLKDLTINGKTIEGFSPTKNEYSITVNIDKVVIGATSEHEKAQIIGNKEETLVIGDNTFQVKVTAENDEENIYKITIKYEKPKSSDNNLKTLELYNGEEKIDFTYDINQTEFEINVAANINKLTIKSTLNDEHASYIKKYENRDVELDYGQNKFELRIKAEDDQVKRYVLNIIREDDRNNNKTLSTLVINDEKVTLSSSIFEYRVDVRYKHSKSDIVATPTDEKATVKFTNIDLEFGENPPINITVIAENGEKQEYKIVINRLSEAESKVTLQNIGVDGYEFPFDINIFDYDLNLINDDKSLIISVVPEDDIEYEILNNENLSDGSTVIIRVKDDNGLKSYTINIHKDINKIFGIPIDIFCYSVFGLGIVSLISSVIYVIVINKKRDNE